MTILAKTAETLGENLRGEAYGYVHTSNDKPNGAQAESKCDANGDASAATTSPSPSNGALVVLLPSHVFWDWSRRQIVSK